MKTTFRIVAKGDRVVGIVWRHEGVVRCTAVDRDSSAREFFRSSSINAGIDAVRKSSALPSETVLVYLVRGFDSEKYPFAKISGAVGRRFKNVARWVRDIRIKGGAR